MKTYPKIYSRYFRDQKGRFILDKISRPEYKVLAHSTPWRWTEKLDGTNVRIWVDESTDQLRWAGRTDRAQLPPGLVQWIRDHEDNYREVLEPGRILFGEGVGAKIQKGGGNYGQDQMFVLFDIWDSKLGWRSREYCDWQADVGRIELAFDHGFMTLDEAEEMVKAGFNSAFGNFLAEGLVGYPALGFLLPDGERVAIKIKHADYR